MPKRVRESSSSEECYASPATQFPPHGLPSPPISSDGRARRTRGSSSDDDPTVGDMVNEDYRAGGPHLAAMPCNTIPLSQDNPAVTWRSDPSFGKAILDMLRNHHIEIKFVELFGRQSEKFDNNDPNHGKIIDTVVVTAKKTQFDNAWISACFDIRNIFLQKRLNDLNIEIVDNRASAKKFASPVPPTHPTYPRWDDLSMRIIQKIGREGWLALECFRWGESLELRGSGDPVTVILTIPRDTSERDWKHPREEIVSVLTDFKLYDVAVSILRGEIFRDAGPQGVVLPDNAWEKESQLGMSIGPSNTDLSASTLGAIIELQSPDGEWMRFGRTCFHSVISNKEEKDLTAAEKKYRQDWKGKGIPPNDKNAADLKMDQPALKDHKRRMEVLEQEINDHRNDERIHRIEMDLNLGNFVIPGEEQYCRFVAEQQGGRLELRDSLWHFSPDKTYLGKVFSASGFRRTDENPPSQLDWALINIENVRMGENKALGEPVWTIQNGRQLFKIGRTTTFTEGKYTGLRSIILPSGEVDHKGNPISHETWEHALVGVDRKIFSKRGDAGAVIFDLADLFVGLLFAGNDQTKATYFTPWPRLVADIKKLTGAKDARIPAN